MELLLANMVLGLLSGIKTSKTKATYVGAMSEVGHISIQEN
jgi:hypothetical protein